MALDSHVEDERHEIAEEAAHRTCPPQDVLLRIISALDMADLRAVRLASHDMARAVDHHTITALCIRRWNIKTFSMSSRRFQNVQSINVLTLPDWDHMQKLASQLPKLHTLCIPDRVNSRMSLTCAASLTSLTRLDLGVNSMQVPSIPLPKRGNVQLPALKAASFSSKHSKAGPAGNGTFDDIAAFAPNLQQLYCHYLEIHASSNSSGAKALLPCCTHYGGSEVHVIDASSKAAGASAFAKAFPKLRVFSCLPHSFKIAAEQKHHGKWSLSTSELLSLCKAVHSVRGFGGAAARIFDIHSNSSSSDKRLGQLQSLRAVSLCCGMSASATLAGAVGQLKGLTRLELLLNAPLSRHGPSPTYRASYLRDMHSQLQQLQLLPHLNTLALPAALLCSCCCNEGHGAAAAHADVLHALEALAGCSSRGATAQITDAAADMLNNSVSDNGSSSSNGSSFRRLVFVDMQWPDNSSYYAEKCWQQPVQHEQNMRRQFEALQAKQQQQQHWWRHVHDTDVAGDQDDMMSLQQQHQQLVLEMHTGLVSSGGLCLDNRGGLGVWGVYGPADW